MRKGLLDTCMGFTMLLLIVWTTNRGLDLAVAADILPETQPPVIVIDSGHGGDDPGKIGINQALEKDINLSIAKKLEQLLSDAGITVVMTRTDDEGLYSASDGNKKIADLNERCRIIEASSPAFVISIHQNSYHEEAISGPQVFYYKNSEEGHRLAETLQAAFSSVTEKNTRKAKANDNYYLLLHTSCPVVIAECGFLSNWEEAELLISENYQNKIAQALCSGILEYLGQQMEKSQPIKESDY